MYKYSLAEQLEFEDFYMPFGGRLRSDNRWVRLSKIIPWEEVEEIYSKQLADSGMGTPAKSGRIAVGALIIQKRLNLTDEETVAQVQENPYLQYFLGYSEYSNEEPFDSSLMVHFRKRLSGKLINQINEMTVKNQRGETEKIDKKKDKEVSNNNDSDKTGKLIIDATCAPGDIRYPTDISLLNEAREKSENIIDQLHEPLKGKEKKVRTYRREARREYLKLAKQRKPGKNKIRKAIGKQLRYLKRNLANIVKLAGKQGLRLLNNRWYKNLLVIHELYRQQEKMYRERKNRISGRIVSISQPHIRPIVRGKASAQVEFGAKLSISMVDGFAYLDRLSWDPYNESQDLKEQVEKYKQRYGNYPKSVHADKIYRTRENRNYCKELGIRLSGRGPGRPKKVTEETFEENNQLKKIEKADELYRIAVEGKFGQGKRRFSLDRIMAKLPDTSEAVISMIILVMNLEKILTENIFAVFSKLIFWCNNKFSVKFAVRYVKFAAERLFQ